MGEDDAQVECTTDELPPLSTMLKDPTLFSDEIGEEFNEIARHQIHFVMRDRRKAETADMIQHAVMLQWKALKNYDATKINGNADKYFRMIALRGMRRWANDRAKGINTEVLSQYEPDTTCRTRQLRPGVYANVKISLPEERVRIATCLNKAIAAAESQASTLADMSNENAAAQAGFAAQLLRNVKRMLLGDNKRSAK